MIPHDTDLSHPTHAYALDVVEGRIVAGPIVRAACKRHLDDLKDAPARGFVFSARKADHAINFFPVVLKLDPSKEEDSDGEPTSFELGDPQKFIIGSLFGWIESNTINDKCSGYRRFRTAYVEQGKGNGKALALDTLILTRDKDCIELRDIVVGDYVYGSNGEPTKVIAVHDEFRGECLKITFDTGTSVVADINHLWSLWGGDVVKTSVLEVGTRLCNYFSPFGVFSELLSARVVAIEFAGVRDVKCITVSAKDGVFLCGGYHGCVPTHNSPVAAGIGMYGLIADGEHRAEIFSAAAKKDQAMIMFKDAVSFVEMSPPLSKRLKLSGKQPNVWNIYDEQTNSNFRPISSDEGQSGARPHIGLIDELHEHKSPLVVNMMGAGQKGRKQPLVFIITNSGSDKQTVCGEYHDKAERVAFGMEQDDRFFSYVCSLDKDDDPFVDEECWIKANPMLGITIQKQYIRDQIAAATMPSKQSDVKRLNFCIWTAADNPFIDYAAWNGALNKFDLSMFANHDDVALGLDLSQVRDLTAAVFSRKIKGHIYWWPEFWIPEAMVHEKTVEDKVPYETWVARGWVRTTPGNTISLSHVANDIKELMKTHRIGIQSAPYDRWRIDDFKKACDSVDLRIKDQLQEFGQGFKDMSPAIDAFERDLMNGYFHHPGNPCLDWCAANAVVISDPAGGRKLDKGSNQRKRIDGIIAGIMSHHATSLLPEQSIPSIRWM